MSLDNKHPIPDLKNIEHNDDAEAKNVVMLGKTSGGAYVPIKVDTDGSIMANYLKLDGSNANQTINIGSEDFTTTGTGTFNNLKIEGGIPILVFKDNTDTGDSARGFQEWRDSNNVRLGYFGNSSYTHDDLVWKNESSGGNLLLETTGTGIVSSNTDFTTTGTGTFGIVNLTDEASGYQIDGEFYIGNEGTENSFMGVGTRNGDLGNYNVFVGYHAGYNNDITDVTVGRDGTSNVYIGARAGAGEVLLTGTLEATNGSDAIVGTDTLFESELVVGDVIRLHEVWGAYEISAIADDTHLTLVSNYTGTTGSGIYTYRERGQNNGNECIAIGHLALSLNSTGYENTALGDNALKMNTTGFDNTALGNDAMQGASGVAITGTHNIAIGGDTLYVLSTGYYNTALGYRALYKNTTGNYNLAIGSGALGENVEGDHNTAIGYLALNNSTGSYNVALGTQALQSTEAIPGSSNMGIGYQVGQKDAGTRNVFVGHQAGQFNDTTGDRGTDNVYIGYWAGKGTTTDTNNTGRRNVALGSYCLEHNTSGVENLAMGTNTLYYNTSGSYNVAIGYRALFDNLGGVANVGIGYSSLYNNLGSNNTGIGYFTGYNNNGANNVFIGYSAGRNQTTVSQYLIIDNQNRSTAAAELTSALLVGLFSATVANQWLKINGEILGTDGAKIGDGGTTNYTEIKADGEIELVGTARVIKSRWFPFNALKEPGTKPATFKEWGISGVWEFSDATDDTIVFNLQVPNDMDITVAPSFLIGWSTNTTVTTETAVWQLEYLYTASGEDTTAAAQETLTVNSNAIAQANGLIEAEITGIDLPEATDKCMHCRLKRLGADGSDDLTDTAELHGVCIKYTSNKLGGPT